jgi:hypothetical protein
MRWSAVAALLMLLVASCGQEVTDPPNSTSSTFNATGSTTSTQPDSSTTAAPAEQGGALPLIEEVGGTAPVRLANPPAPVVYLIPDPTFDVTIEPPAGLQVEFESCSTVGPGVLAYEVVLDGDVAYPFTVTVVLGLFAGDQGTGLWGTVEFTDPGRQLIVGAVADYAAVVEDRRDLNADGAAVDRDSRWNRSGYRCELEIGSTRTQDRHDLELVFGALEITAPAGTVEALAQQAFAGGLNDPLRPLAVAYGDAVQFYAERWFVPEAPSRLQRIVERLDAQRCLETEFIYDGYTVTQRRGCPTVEREAVYRAGDRWFATGTDGVWLLQVEAPDAATAEAVLGSLRPVWHLSHREVPLTPVNEGEIGRAKFQGGEVLVTFGEQRCTGNCRSPEGWFFVYRIVGDEIEEIANYPGYGVCLLAEEEPFVVAVAPQWGHVELTEPNGTVTRVEADEEPPFVFVDRSVSTANVQIFDEDGEVPRCVGLLVGDTRGGIESPADTSPGAEPETSRTVEAGPCGGLPQYLSDFTDEDPVRLACANSTQGGVTVAQVIPNEMMAEPPDGLDCLVALVGNGASASCWMVGDDPEPILSGSDTSGLFVAFVPEGTTRIVGVTDRGTELIGIPHDRLVMIWWRASEGDLRSVVAETAGGPIVLYDG